MRVNEISAALREMRRIPHSNTNHNLLFPAAVCVCIASAVTFKTNTLTAETNRLVTMHTAIIQPESLTRWVQLRIRERARVLYVSIVGSGSYLPALSLTRKLIANRLRVVRSHLTAPPR